MEQSLSQTPHLIIKPSSGWQLLNLRELWHYKDLILTLAGRDMKLRYRQTALGAIWIVLAPLLSAGIFTFIFGRIAKLPSEGVPYFLFVFAGQCIWSAFSGIVGRTGGSLVANQNLVSKIYFPRVALPISTIGGVSVDFGVIFAMLIVLMILSGTAPSAGLLTLPLLLLAISLFALGIGLIIAALSVSYRDAGAIGNHLLQFLVYGSPVYYSVETVPAHLLGFYYLNPMAVLVQAFRWAVLDTSPPPVPYVLYAVVFSVAAFFAGTLIFNRMERRFADVI